MRIGIDLGGTKIAGVALDEAGKVHAPARVPTPRDYGEVLRALRELIAGIEAEIGEAASVGIGTPGATSPETGLMINAENTALEDHPFARDIARELRRPVRLANDANCFALSEAVDGAGAGASIVVGLILGTGAGAGIVVDRKPLAGINASAGEWGYNPLPWPKPGELEQVTCYCGKQGCIEMFVSGPGMARDHEYVTGQKLDARAIEVAAAEGDEAACATLERFHDRLARSTATIVNLLDPGAIVLGGGLSKLAGIEGELAKRLPAYTFTGRLRTRIARSVHGDDSGVRGAAWLWAPDEWIRGLPER